MAQIQKKRRSSFGTLCVFLLLFLFLLWGLYTVDAACRSTMLGENSPLWQVVHQGNDWVCTIGGFGLSFSFSVPDWNGSELGNFVNNSVEYVDKKLQEVIHFLRDTVSFRRTGPIPAPGTGESPLWRSG